MAASMAGANCARVQLATQAMGGMLTDHEAGRSHHGLQLALVPRKFCQTRPRRRVCTAKAQEAYPQSQDGKKQEQVICGPSRRQLLIATTGGWVGLGSDAAEARPKSLYDLTVKYKEADYPLDKYRDMNYPGLRYLYNKYKDQGFTLLAFPSNQFGGQAPGTSDEEREYAYYKFGFEFPVFDKIDVKGPAMSPVYDFLKSKQPGEIEWNYVKFLVNRDGVPVRRYKPGFDPVDFEEDLVATLEGRPLPAKQRVYLGAP